MINKTDLEFKDISNEEYRIYVFPEYVTIRIDKPTHLNISKSGGHRLLDENGESHYIPTGWVQIKWRAKKCEANFVA